MSKEKSTKGKKIKRVLLILLILLVLFIAGVFTANKILLSQELSMLDEKGYYNLVSVGDYSLNVCIYGNENGKHKIVPMSGSGDCDLSVDIRTVTDKLSDDNQIIFVDRAGYGLSDDTSVTQTVDIIVDDYRNALKNAGIEGPYVLVPHSISGLYATYWSNKYPDEIEGIVFLDGTILEEDPQWVEDIPFITQKLSVLACKLGLVRLVSDNYIYPLTDGHTEEQQQISKALFLRQPTSNASMSENVILTENIKKAWNELEPNDVPKNYVCAGRGFQTKEEVIEHTKFVNEQMKKVGQPEIIMTDEIIKIALEKTEKERETQLKPYIEKMGNCELTLLGGDHFIFEQKPDECVKIISDFLAKIEKK